MAASFARNHSLFGTRSAMRPGAFVHFGLFLCVVAHGVAFVPSGASWPSFRASPAHHPLRGSPLTLAQTTMVESCSRREVLKDAAKSAVLLGMPATFPLHSNAEESVAEADKVYDNTKSGFRIAYPTGWKESKKPVQTHQDEIQFKSSTSKGTEVGVTVDPVKIDSVAQFGTPKEVGKRVIGVEKAKDGVASARLLAVSQTEYEGVPYYTIEYESDSSRGNKHFIACVAISRKKLFVVTGQAKKDAFAAEEQNLRRSVASFRLAQPS